MFALIIWACTGLFAWITPNNIASIAPSSFFKPKLIPINLLSSTEHHYVLIMFQSTSYIVIYKAALPSEATDEQHLCFQRLLASYQL